MARQSLLEYFQPDSRPAREVAFVWREGYRTIRLPYGRFFSGASQFGLELDARGVRKGDRVLLWGENSGAWVSVFLGCLMQGAIAVPMDASSEKGFVQRVVEQAGVKLAVVARPLQSPLESARTILMEDCVDRLRDPAAPAAGKFPPARTALADPVEIVFTSGTTAEPRGVVLTHGNFLANLEPIEKEIARYRRYERIFHPLCFLDLLPLSHVFGQMLGIFLPQILGATSVFLDTLNPAEIIREIRRERVSVLVTVPRIAESLRDHVVREQKSQGWPNGTGAFHRNFAAGEGEHYLRRWWRFRAIHREFGWKFWALISGGAALPADVEKFWGRLGYAVIQGYGLTETTSLVSVNHPFRLGKGSIGKTLPGREVKLSDEGEILIRGENVASGYWKDPKAQSRHNSAVSPVSNADGWFATGDLGEKDANGNLYFKGRKKNVIVTPEGLNVYPEDLELELRKEGAVRDCVVVGLERDGNAEPCAVLLLNQHPNNDDESGASVVRAANERLAPFQQIRRWMVWPDSDFPRTPTQKPALARIREAAGMKLGDRARDLSSSPGPATGGPLAEILKKVLHGRVHSDAEKLQLSSIERVELLAALEDRYQVDLSETAFSDIDTIGGIDRLLHQPFADSDGAKSRLYHYPSWAQRWPARFLRAFAINLLVRPLVFLLGRPKIIGAENIRDQQGPLLIVANHITYLDPVFILAALPAHLRSRLAVAMDGEFLESLRTPAAGLGFFKRISHRAAYWLAICLFNVFPLPLQAGFRQSFAYAGDLVDRGWSVLVFPEGARTRDGLIAPFRSGTGMLAARLRVPVLPVYLGGIFALKQAGEKRARAGRIKVIVGAPAIFEESDPAENIARDLETRVAGLSKDGE